MGNRSRVLVMVYQSPWETSSSRTVCGTLIVGGSSSSQTSVHGTPVPIGTGSSLMVNLPEEPAPAGRSAIYQSPWNRLHLDSLLYTGSHVLARPVSAVHQLLWALAPAGHTTTAMPVRPVPPLESDILRFREELIPLELLFFRIYRLENDEVSQFSSTSSSPSWQLSSHKSPKLYRPN